MTINRETLVTLHAGAGEEEQAAEWGGTIGEFAFDNWMEESEIEPIIARLAETGVTTYGGGAQPLWTIRVAIP